VAGYKPRWFTRSQTVTHPRTNRARRRITSLIETKVLPLSQAASVVLYPILERDRFWTFLLRSGDEMVKTVYVKNSTFKMVYDKHESYAATM